MSLRPARATAEATGDTPATSVVDLAADFARPWAALDQASDANLVALTRHPEFTAAHTPDLLQRMIACAILDRIRLPEVCLALEYLVRGGHLTISATAPCADQLRQLIDTAIMCWGPSPAEWRYRAFELLQKMLALPQFDVHDWLGHPPANRIPSHDWGGGTLAEHPLATPATWMRLLSVFPSHPVLRIAASRPESYADPVLGYWLREVAAPSVVKDLGAARIGVAAQATTDALVAHLSPALLRRAYVAAAESAPSLAGRALPLLPEAWRCCLTRRDITDVFIHGDDTARQCGREAIEELAPVGTEHPDVARATAPAASTRPTG